MAESGENTHGSLQRHHSLQAAAPGAASRRGAGSQLTSDTPPAITPHRQGRGAGSAHLGWLEERAAGRRRQVLQKPKGLARHNVPFGKDSTETELREAAKSGLDN